MSATQRDLTPILIAGPTASGKSAIAMAIAVATDGTIINADSMQVYRELRVLTARPTSEDEARVPHALYGFVPASEAYSAGRFVRDAAAAIAKSLSEGRRPIIVGGTGLYFKALLEGLSPIPEVRADIREHWRAVAERRGASALHEDLARLDPIMATRLQPSDAQRIVRALEVLQSTGRSLAEWQMMRGKPVLEEPKTKRLVVGLDRAELHARADRRFESMIKSGAIEEVRALVDMQLDSGFPAMRAIGVTPISAVLAGESTLEQAVSSGQAETRQYIKRQETWLKRHMISWKCINAQYLENNMRDIFAFIRG